MSESQAQRVLQQVTPENLLKILAEDFQINQNNINASAINSVIASVFLNSSSNNPLYFDTKNVNLTAFDTRRGSLHDAVNLQLDRYAPTNDTQIPSCSVPTSTISNYDASFVVFTQFSIGSGVFETVPEKLSASIYGLSLTDDNGDVIEVK